MEKLMIVVSLLMLAACGNDKKSAQKDLRDQVISIHDSIMPEMGTIRKLKKQIDLKLESLDSSAQAEMEELKAKSEKLEVAGDEMMKWMREYEDDFENKTHEEVIQYLEEQKKLIEEVESKMTTAITETKEYLGDK